MTVRDDSPVVLPDDPTFGPEVQVDYPGYRSTQWRAPKRKLLPIPEGLHSLAGPVFGRFFEQRLVTQMYFPGDPLFEFDPIFNSVRDPRSRALLVSRFDIARTEPQWALAYEWDIVLGRGGAGTTPVEENG